MFTCPFHCKSEMVINILTCTWYHWQPIRVRCCFGCGVEDFSLFPGSGACKPRKLCILSLAKILWRMLKKNLPCRKNTAGVYFLCASWGQTHYKRETRHSTMPANLFFSKSNFTGDQVSLGKMLDPKLPLMIPLVSECLWYINCFHCFHNFVLLSLFLLVIHTNDKVFTRCWNY